MLLLMLLSCLEDFSPSIRGTEDHYQEHSESKKEQAMAQGKSDFIHAATHFFSTVRYLAYSALQVVGAVVVWGALFYVMHPWTHNGFPAGDFIFLTWSVLLGLLASEIYHGYMCSTPVTTLAMENPVHGGLALAFGISVATAFGFGILGGQNFASGVYTLFWASYGQNYTEAWQNISYRGILYILIAAGAALATAGAGRDIIHDISYHSDLLSRRNEEE